MLGAPSTEYDKADIFQKASIYGPNWKSCWPFSLIKIFYFLNNFEYGMYIFSEQKSRTIKKNRRTFCHAGTKSSSCYKMAKIYCPMAAGVRRNEHFAPEHILLVARCPPFSGHFFPKQNYFFYIIHCFCFYIIHCSIWFHFILFNFLIII